MRACVHACMHACMYACLYLCLCVCLFVFFVACMRAYLTTAKHISSIHIKITYIHTHTYTLQNPDETAVWRGIRKVSRAWRQRDRKILELVWAKYDNQVHAIIMYASMYIHTLVQLDPKHDAIMHICM
jgi:hypothetical protein